MGDDGPAVAEGQTPAMRRIRHAREKVSPAPRPGAREGPNPITHERAQSARNV
jgi:hypothetical protein